MWKSLSEVDPEWAWNPYVPAADRPWTPRLAAHLHRRGAFGATAAVVNAAVALGPAAAVASLFAAEEPEPFRKQMEDLTRANIAGGDPKTLSAGWLYRLLATPSPLRERSVLFWHGHFATSAAKVTDPELMSLQNATLRRHALGSFGELAHDMARDPAMLIWLDSATNRRVHPNENFARELMELFCLGEGRYTEADIRELARCFTGWEVRRGRFRVNPEQHDTGRKTILGESGEFSGEQGVDLVLRQAACPQFIVRKLIRQFLFDEPEAPDALVEPLARQFREQNLAIAPLLQRLLGSNLFFSPFSIGRRVKSPVELVVGLLRTLEGSTNVLRLSQPLAELGQELFFPPNVKGWDGGRTWINSATLLGRANMVKSLLDDSSTRFGGGTLEEFMARQGTREASEIVDRLIALLFSVPIPAAAREAAITVIDSGGNSREQRLRNALHLLCALPEFQLV
ncbi:MAG: DUF1800 domain-containing protein [Planctomycetaceae bacterium]|nr:MAG: DUF1800 domain-containing protein [Planctomycetaceae bacterium]